MLRRKITNESGFAPILMFLFFILLIFGGIGISQFEKLSGFLCGKKNLGNCFENITSTPEVSGANQNNLIPASTPQNSATTGRNDTVGLNIRLSEFSAGNSIVTVSFEGESLVGVIPIRIQGQTIQLRVQGIALSSSGEISGDVSGKATFSATDGTNNVFSQVEYTGKFTGIIKPNNKASGNLSLTQHVTAEGSKGALPSKTETIQIPWEGEAFK